jgi:hypothetical protein
VRSLKAKIWIPKIVKQRLYLEVTYGTGHSSGQHINTYTEHHFISKPQLELFCKIKREYPDEDVVLEQRVVITGDADIIDDGVALLELESKNPESIRVFSIDVAIPRLKLGFEFYGKYWHGNNVRGENRLETDLERIKLLEVEGWTMKIYRDEDLSCV